MSLVNRKHKILFTYETCDLFSGGKVSAATAARETASSSILSLREIKDPAVSMIMSEEIPSVMISLADAPDVI